MKKVSKFFKNYGFYLAVGIICIGALAAIFIMPNKEDNVGNEANPYAKNEVAGGNDLQSANEEDGVIIVDEDDLDMTEEEIDDSETPADSAEGVTETNDNESVIPDTTEAVEPTTDEMTTDEEANNETIKEETANEMALNESTSDDVAANETEEVEPETFESTTVSIADEPFFAEGDTFTWPVDGNVVVPYTDESTSHWYSESLNQTMRTFGICITGQEGTQVKSVARGTVIDIVDDSSSYLDAGMPYVGKLMIIDLGNGYTAIYGFQGGTVNEALVGQVVNAGDTLGTLGSPKGPFIGQGDNIYLQVTHNDEVVNPLNFLQTEDGAVKEDSVDLGFTK